MPYRLPKPCGIIFLVLALLLTGCQRTPEPAASQQPGPDSTLRRSLGAPPETLDPRMAADNASLAVLTDLYEGLTTEMAEGAIVPGAAEAWTVTPDGLAWTFHLRPSLRWSNGEPLTAADFAAALEAVVAPGSTAPNGALFDALVAVETTDASTLVLHLERPLPYLPALLALPVAAPLYRGPDATTAPSNGPYRLVDRRSDRVELERNPHYREAPSVQVERVVYRVVEDLTAELNLYRTDELDLTSEVPNSQIEWIHERLPGELRVAPFLSTYAYAVNIERLPDPIARRALAMAVDRERITRRVTGAGERPAHGWVPDGIPGYVPARFQWNNLPYEAAAREARTLWTTAAERGTAPARIKLCTDASANHRRTAVALADLWRSALGVETEIAEFEWNVYLDRRRNPGDCDLVRLGWSADFVDAEAFADVFESGHPQNTLGYTSGRYDALLQDSRLASDSEQRSRQLAAAEAQLLADAPVIPVFFRVSKRLVKPHVGGYHANPLGHVASRDLRLEPR
jgi:ABC-type oligopeptide transport system substrate-binding subunit